MDTSNFYHNSSLNSTLSNSHNEGVKNIPSFTRHVQILSSAMEKIPHPLSNLTADYNERNWFTFCLLKRSKTEPGLGIWIFCNVSLARLFYVP